MKTKQQRSMQDLWKDSYLNGGNDAYLEELYETYLKNPETLTPDWQNYFKELAQSTTDVSHADIRNYFLQLARLPKTTSQSSMPYHEHQQEKVEADSAHSLY